MGKRRSVGLKAPLAALPEVKGSWRNGEPFPEQPPVGPQRGSYRIPRLGGALKLLVDQGRQMGVHPVPDNEVLGANIVENGDFHDFTMDNDSNVKGHWIFDDYYNQQEGGGGYIGEDWSQGGAVYGSNLNSDPGFESGTDNWTPVGGSVEQSDEQAHNGNYSLKYVNTNGGNYGGPQKQYSVNVGSVYYFEIAVFTPSTNSPNSAITRVSIYNSTFSTTYFEKDSVSGNDFWKKLSGYFIPQDSTIYIRVKVQYPQEINDVIYIDDVILQEITNGNHLLPSSGFDYTNQLTGSNPAYQNGHAVEFDQVNDYWYIPADQAGDFSKAIGTTVEGRIRPVNNSAKKAFLRYNGNKYIMLKVFDNVFRIQWKDASDVIRTKDIANFFDSFIEFTYFAVVIPDANTIKLYKNGELFTVLDVSANPIVDATADNLFVIGSDYSAHFGGHIAEIRYSNVARTEQEIKESYGLAKGWNWDNNAGGTYYNDNFKQHISTLTFSEGLKQTVYVQNDILYKFEGDVTHISGDNPWTWESETGTVISYDVPLGETIHFVRYFKAIGSSAVIHLKDNGIGENVWDNISIRPVLNASFSGTTITDYSGHGNHGTMQGGMEDNQPAHPAAWRLDGVDDYGDFGNVCNVGINDFIVFAWVRTDNSSTNARIFCKRSGIAGYEMAITSSGYANFFIGDGTNQSYGGVGNGDLNSNEWKFYVLAFDKDGSVTAWVDGEKIGEKDISAVGDASTTASLFFGKDISATYWEDFLGISGIYIFDGQDGAPARLPEGYESLIRYIYYQTKFLYEGK